MDIDPSRIAFRELEKTDIPLLTQWLNEPHVRAWYAKNEIHTLRSVSDKYIPRITGKQPTHGYISKYDTIDVGYIQWYYLRDYAEWKQIAQKYLNATGIDLFIGNSDFLHKGFGYQMLSAFVEGVLFSREDITTCIVGPEPENKQAIKSYERAGFRYIETVTVSGEEAYLMKRSKI